MAGTVKMIHFPVQCWVFLEVGRHLSWKKQQHVGKMRIDFHIRSHKVRRNILHVQYIVSQSEKKTLYIFFEILWCSKHSFSRLIFEPLVPFWVPWITWLGQSATSEMILNLSQIHSFPNRNHTWLHPSEQSQQKKASGVANLCSTLQSLLTTSPGHRGGPDPTSAILGNGARGDESKRRARVMGTLKCLGQGVWWFFQHTQNDCLAFVNIYIYIYIYIWVLNQK